MEELIALLTTPRNCSVKYCHRWNISLSAATRNFLHNCGFRRAEAFSRSSGYLVYLHFPQYSLIGKSLVGKGEVLSFLPSFSIVHLFAFLFFAFSEKLSQNYFFRIRTCISQFKVIQSYVRRRSRLSK